MSNDTPLWWVMKCAYWEALEDGHDINAAHAAQLRAVADWLVPDEPDLTPEEGDDLVLWSKWRTRTRLRDRLLAEIARAEAGE